MRKLLLVSGLLLGGALLTSGPASAEVGCGCVKLGAAPVCVSSIAACARMGGLCLVPCDYKAPKKMVKRHWVKKKMAKKPAMKKPAMKKPAPKAMKKPAEKKAM